MKHLALFAALLVVGCDKPEPTVAQVKAEVGMANKGAKMRSEDCPDDTWNVLDVIIEMGEATDNNETWIPAEPMDEPLTS